MTQAERDDLLIRIDERLKAQNDRMEQIREDLKEDIGQVYLQAKLTNGRVNTLEDDKHRQKGFRAALVGIAVALSTIVGMIIEYFKH